MRHASFFSGCGGLDLAAHWAGFETVCFCEIEDAPARVFQKHWPDAFRYRDIRDVRGAEIVERFGTIKLVSGGFPCQPFSTAGKRGGQKDDRYLWPEMFRVITEIRPDWVVGENVAGFADMGLTETVSDLESAGYEVGVFEIPACAVNAPHERQRLFIIANANGERLPEPEPFPGAEWVEHLSRMVTGKRPPVWGKDKPGLGRTLDGLPGELDTKRIKMLGNAVVPYQAYPIMQAIALIEKGKS